MIKKQGNEGYEAPDFVKRKDRIGTYFHKYLTDFVFDEFSERHLKREDLEAVMKGVPIPMRHQDVVDFHTKKGLPLLHIAENMAWIMGINPQFQYVPAYIAYLRRYFDAAKIADAVVKEGRDHAEKEEMEQAVIHFRAALALDPGNLHAMYSYARGCRELYLQGEGKDDTEYVGRFKAEALEYFELTTLVHPKFDQAFYYLGYAYLNMGLYIKAVLVWKEFLKLSRNKEDKEEIQERIEQLEQPMEIETGCNHVMASRWVDGIEVLEPFLSTQYESWWPLHYYLGAAYARMGDTESALKRFKRTLELNPSHIETMEELAAIYEEQSDAVLAEKYRKKIQVIQN